LKSLEGQIISDQEIIDSNKALLDHEEIEEEYDEEAVPETEAEETDLIKQIADAQERIYECKELIDKINALLNLWDINDIIKC